MTTRVDVRAGLGPVHGPGPGDGLGPGSDRSHAPAIDGAGAATRAAGVRVRIDRLVLTGAAAAAQGGQAAGWTDAALGQAAADLHQRIAAALPQPLAAATRVALASAITTALRQALDRRARR